MAAADGLEKQSSAEVIQPDSESRRIPIGILTGGALIINNDLT